MPRPGLITPLVELPRAELLGIRRQNPLDPASYLGKMADDLLQSCGAGPVFVDLALLGEGIKANGEHPLARLGKAVRGAGVRVIPVTGLSRLAEYQTAALTVAKAHQAGVAIRLIPSDLKPNLSARLQTVTKRLGLAPHEVHLIIDRQVVSAGEPRYLDLLALVPSVSKWGTVTVLAGAFPPDLACFQKPGEYTLERHAWLAWHEQVVRNGRSCAFSKR